MTAALLLMALYALIVAWPLLFLLHIARLLRTGRWSALPAALAAAVPYSAAVAAYALGAVDGHEGPADRTFRWVLFMAGVGVALAWVLLLLAMRHAATRRKAAS
jgi:hypothetical protein